MRVIRLLFARLRGLFHRDAISDEIREELEFHLRMRAEEYERAGETPVQAARLARERVGNVAVLLDRGYDVRGGGVMETILQDVRYALRLLGRQRGFTVLAIVTLALGIGLSTALVSVLDAAILHPLPYPHPEQLVQVLIDSPQPDGRILHLGPSIERARTMMTAGHVFSDIAVSRNIFTPLVTDDLQPERLRGMEITEGYLPLFGVKPLLGRGIEADDTRPGAAAVVLLGFDYWQRRYAGSPDVVGQTIRFDAGPATIVGVLPSTFSRRTAIWRPLVVTRFLLALDGAGTATDARLRTGVTLDRAARELTDLMAPGKRGRPKVALRLLLDSERRGKQIVRTLAWAVGLILLIACVNVGGLLLARGSTRLPELAIRGAIGAGRLRLVRQLMTESLVLAAAGGIAGILTAWWSLDALVATIPISLPSNSPAVVNIRVLAFSVGLSLVTGVVFGLAHALSLSRVRVANGLARGARGAASQLSRRSGQILIGIEVALAVVLLAAAGLMVSSFARLLAADLGFNPDGFITLEVCRRLIRRL
jgi:predicted permease